MVNEGKPKGREGKDLTFEVFPVLERDRISGNRVVMDFSNGRVLSYK